MRILPQSRKRIENLPSSIIRVRANFFLLLFRVLLRALALAFPLLRGGIIVTIAVISASASSSASESANVRESGNVYTNLGSDKNPGDKSAEKRYVELNNAYEILGDKSKRQRYDLTGQFETGGDGEDDDGGWNPFSDLFGGGRRRRREREEKRVPDLVVPMAVDLELLYTGGMIDISHKRQILCPMLSDCEKTCPRCGGAGVIIQTRRLGPGFVQQIQTTCPDCGGTGKIWVKNCKSCPNGKFEKEEQLITLDILRGAPDGHRITEGQTDELPDHTPGDVHFELHARPHKRFERRGNDLHYRQVITLREALLGVKRQVMQLDGRSVDIVTEGVTAPNEELRIKGEGMPVFGTDGAEAGDMVVHFWVKFPTKLSDEQKKFAAQMLPETAATTSDAGSSTIGEGSSRDEL